MKFSKLGLAFGILMMFQLNTVFTYYMGDMNKGDIWDLSDYGSMKVTLSKK